MNCADLKEPICTVRFSPAGADGEFCLRCGHREKCHEAGKHVAADVTLLPVQPMSEETVDRILAETLHATFDPGITHYDGLTTTIAVPPGFNLEAVQAAVKRFTAEFDEPKELLPPPMMRLGEPFRYADIYDERGRDGIAPIADRLYFTKFGPTDACAMCDLYRRLTWVRIIPRFIRELKQGAYWGEFICVDCAVDIRRGCKTPKTSAIIERLTSERGNGALYPRVDPFRIIHPVPMRSSKAYPTPIWPYIPPGTILRPPPDKPGDYYEMKWGPYINERRKMVDNLMLVMGMTREEAQKVAAEQFPESTDHELSNDTLRREWLNPPPTHLWGIAPSFGKCVHGCQFHHTDTEYLPDGTEIERRYSGGSVCYVQSERILNPDRKSGQRANFQIGKDWDAIWPRMPIEYGRRITPDIKPFVGWDLAAPDLGKDLEAWVNRQKCVTKFNEIVAYHDAPFEPRRLPR